MVDEQFDFYIKAFQRDINCLIHTVSFQGSYLG